MTTDTPGEGQTETVNALVTDFLRRYPDPLRLLRRVFPGCVSQAKALGLSNDELRSACLEGLVRAAKRHDPTAGDFATFAPFSMRAVVEEDVYRLQRDIDRRCGGRVASMSDGVIADEVINRGCRADVAEAVEDADLAAVVRTAVDGMSDGDRELIRKAFGLDGCAISLRSLAKDYGVHSKTLRRRLDAALERLRPALPSAPC